jgi:hypothetical protein
MDRIPDVEKAKALMAEAVTWSVIKWLREKKSVRKMADQANAALDQLNEAVQERWPDDVRAAYESLVETASARTKRPANGGSPIVPNSQVILRAKKARDANDEAHHARMDAEQTFDLAEKQLSTALAREGCRKAILSWELHERAIRKAEALIDSQ